MQPRWEHIRPLHDLGMQLNRMISRPAVGLWWRLYHSMTDGLKSHECLQDMCLWWGLLDACEVQAVHCQHGTSLMDPVFLLVPFCLTIKDTSPIRFELGDSVQGKLWHQFQISVHSGLYCTSGSFCPVSEGYSIRPVQGKHRSTLVCYGSWGADAAITHCTVQWFHRTVHAALAQQWV